MGEQHTHVYAYLGLVDECFGAEEWWQAMHYSTQQTLWEMEYHAEVEGGTIDPKAIAWSHRSGYLHEGVMVPTRILGYTAIIR